jgi:hypothetical protein
LRYLYFFLINFPKQFRKAGIIAILESDQARLITDNRDQVEYFGASLGFPYYHYGIKTRMCTWGCALLSLYPIVNNAATVLPSPKGTKSCLIDVVLNVSGYEVSVLISHFSTEEFPEDLDMQSSELAKIAAAKTMPTIVLCYITSAPTSDKRKPPHMKQNYEKLIKVGGLKDPDPEDFDRWCQYIFYKNIQCLNFYHVNTFFLSDTEALAADFSLKFSCHEKEKSKCQTSYKPVVAKVYDYDIKHRKLVYKYNRSRL